MKLLLDTHAFIWWDSEPGNLSAHALALCQDPANTLMLSVASVWEMQIFCHMFLLWMVSLKLIRIPLIGS
jgi:PIN domain nuclease of toxin-antitoxin system